MAICCPQVFPPDPEECIQILESEIDVLAFFYGVNAEGCWRFEVPYDSCRMAENIDAGVVDRVVGKDTEGCLVCEDDGEFVGRNETPWTGTGTNGIVVTPGGINGHAPTISIDFCELEILEADLTRIYGDDGSDTSCIFWEDAGELVTRLETPWTGTGINGIVVTPGGVNGHAPILSVDTCDIPVNVGILTSVLGRDMQGCFIDEDPRGFVERNETPWTGIGGVGIEVISGGTNGHQPTINIDICDFQLPVGGEVDFVVGVDEGGCLRRELDGPFVVRNETPWTGTGVNGIVVTAGGVNGHAPILSLDLCELVVNPGVVTRVLGQDVAGCMISEDDQTFVVRNETPWTGTGGAGITITPGGTNGHAPNIEVVVSPTCLDNALVLLGDGLCVPRGANANTQGPITGDGSTANPIDIDFTLMTAQDMCDWASNLTTGTLTQLIGIDGSGCPFVQPVTDVVCDTFGRIPAGGFVADGTLLVGADCEVYTYQAFDLCTSLGNLPTGGILQDGQELIGEDCQTYTFQSACTQIGNFPNAGNLTTGQRLVGEDCNTYVYRDTCTEIGLMPNGGALPDGQVLVGANCQLYTYSEFDLCDEFAGLPSAGNLATGTILVGADCQRHSYRDTCTEIGLMPSGGNLPNGQQIVGNNCNVYTYRDTCTEIGLMPAAGDITDGTQIVGANCQLYTYREETVTTLTDNGDNTYTYTNEDGDDVTFDICGCVTTLVDNNDRTFTYTSEDATVTTITVPHMVFMTTPAAAPCAPTSQLGDYVLDDTDPCCPKTYVKVADACAEADWRDISKSPNLGSRIFHTPANGTQLIPPGAWTQLLNMPITVYDQFACCGPASAGVNNLIMQKAGRYQISGRVDSAGTANTLAVGSTLGLAVYVNGQEFANNSVYNSGINFINSVNTSNVPTCRGVGDDATIWAVTDDPAGVEVDIWGVAIEYLGECGC